jgi:CRP/FNR family transcriptional regulator, cyclic AMP receptor protein
MLQQMPVFGGIRDDIVEFILSIARSVAVHASEHFFREGDAGDSMFVLTSGRAEVVNGASGQEHQVRELAQGDCFGEMSLLDLSPRSATVRALESCSAIEISAGCLYQVYGRDVEQFALIEMNMGRELSRRLRESTAALTAMRSRPR